MKIIKRNGAEETFRIEKIIVAITKANNAAEDAERLTPLQIDRIAQAVAIRCEEMNRSLSVEEIQDLVEDQIMAHGVPPRVGRDHYLLAGFFLQCTAQNIGDGAL